MPKNTVSMKSKMRSKSTRKPLQDVSNAKTAIKSAKTISGNDGGKAGDDSLDRLLLVHSDLSSLLRQIDELVVQALQSTSNKGRKEIKQFADALSDIQASLKPWVPRFQKALLSQSTGPENKSEQSMERTVPCVSKESTIAIESPEETKWESLVSPSPLVSWRAECNTEGGRQLFLLTPLPQRKAFSSKCQPSSLPAFENITADEIAHHVPLTDSIGNLGDDLPEGASAKLTPNRALDIQVTNAVGNLHTDCSSPEKFSTTSCSLFLMTPCLKMSPPKSCMLLEPIAELSQNRNKKQGVYRATPFPVGVQISSESLDSESSGAQSSENLKLKYPELYGIKIENWQKRIAADDSPNWIVSPPKSCIIMEPPDVKLLENLSADCLPLETTEVLNQQDDVPSMKSNTYQASGTFDFAESTPMMKEYMSSFRKGKHPGENTLKRELWTKFDAASTYSICSNGSLLQNTINKGFLDRLEEASDA